MSFMRILPSLVLPAAFTAVFCLTGCRSDPPVGTGAPDPQLTAGSGPVSGNTPASLNYYFYLESSLSINAYIAPANTRFHHAVNQLQAFLNTHPSRKSFSIREISNIAYDVFPNATDAQVAAYFSNLTPAALQKHAAAAKANRTTSNLSQIIATMLEKTGPDDVSVLVSDCVVDTKDNGNNLASQQSQVQTMVSRRMSKSPLAALVLRDTSEFRNGEYYPPAGGKEILTGYRPYFLILTGPPTVVQQLATGLAARAPFYAQSVLLGPKAAPPATTLLPPMGGLEYYASDPESARNLIAKKARLSGPGKNFVLQIEADLSQVAATETDKQNPENYEVTPANYRLAIQPKTHGRYTHVFTLTSATLGPDHQVAVKMKSTLPNWVAQSSSTHTGFIKNNPAEMSKTYGLQYLIRGFAEGFNPSPYLFEMKQIQVRR